MDAQPDIASVARILAEPARATMLLRLLDGRALTAGELARAANISPQTASSHLAQLRRGGLISLEKQGRHRYFRLSGTSVAAAIESLMAISPEKGASRSERGLPADQLARTCYDHLAGRLGVMLADALVDKGWLSLESDDYRVTAAGENGFRSFGIELTLLRKERRQFARKCLDWSERRHHVAGALGAALAQNLFERKWLLKNRAERSVHVTNAGRQGLHDFFGLRL